MTDEQLYQTIISGDLAELYNLAGTYKEEDKGVETAYQIAKTGTKINFHIGWYLKNHYVERDRDGTVMVMNKQIPIEEWWDELEERGNTLRKALIEFAEGDDEVYNPR